MDAVDGRDRAAEVRGDLSRGEAATFSTRTRRSIDDTLYAGALVSTWVDSQLLMVLMASSHGRRRYDPGKRAVRFVEAR